MFTENQVRQFYVTNTNAVAPSGDNPTNASNAGAMKFVAKGDEAYFLYKGVAGTGVQRTDLIKKCNVMDVRFTAAEDLAHKKNKWEVTLDSNVSATPIVGQDYILNVFIKNYIANGNDSTKVKFGAAHATTTTASDLYKKLAISLAKNFLREAVPMIAVYLKTASDPVLVTAKDTATSLTGTTATGILLEEVEQPWRRGAAPEEFVYFDVECSTIYANGEDQVWGVAKDVTADNANVIVNSKHVADMEWFFHKERGDKYGELGWPNNIDTQYQVDPNNANGYSFVDIHFYFEGNSMNVGRSEKTLTIVGPKANLKTLVGVAASGDDPATGLYAFLEGTGVTIKTSANW